jgi:hypothetical protein
MEVGIYRTAARVVEYDGDSAPFAGEDALWFLVRQSLQLGMGYGCRERGKKQRQERSL